jgi:acyl carrier protein
MPNDSHDDLNIPAAKDAASMPDCCPAPKPAPSRVREYVAPRNEVESGVVEILSGYLKAQSIGIHDNFILLGGESLLAAQAAWSLRERFGCEVTLRSILAGTVSDIASEISAAEVQEHAGSPDNVHSED